MRQRKGGGQGQREREPERKSSQLGERGESLRGQEGIVAYDVMEREHMEEATRVHLLFPNCVEDSSSLRRAHHP